MDAVADSSLSLSLVIGAALGNTFGSTFGAAKKTLGGLGKTAEKMRLGKRITGDIVDLNRRLEELRGKQRGAGDGADRLAREIVELERKLEGVNREAEQHGIAIGGAAAAQRKFGVELGKTEAQLGKTQRKQELSAKRAALKGRAVGLLGAAYGIGRIFDRSLDIEEQRIRLRTVINAEDGDAEAAVERAVAHARETARKTLASESELLEIQYELNSAGLDEEAARVGGVIAAKVARVTAGDVGAVAKVMGTVRNNMGASMARIGDVLTQTQFKFAISDFGQLGAGLAEAAAGAVSAKLPLEQTAAAVGALNTAGLDGGRAGTALNAVLRQLGKAGDALGFRMTRGADGALDLGATLQALHERLPPPTAIDARAAAIQELFGDEGKAGLTPLLEGLDKYRAGLRSLGESAGVVDSAYQDFVDSAGGQWTQLTKNLVTIGTTLGGTMLPAINALLTPLADFAGSLGKLIERSPALGAAIGGLATALGALGAAWAGLAWFGKGELLTVPLKEVAQASWKTARGGLPALGQSLRTFGGRLTGLASRALPVAVGGLRTLGAALLGIPGIGWAAAAIAAAGFLIYKYWQPLQAFFKGVWEGFQQALQPVLAALSPLAAVFAAVGAAATWVGAALKPVIDWFGSLFAPLNKSEEQLSGIAAAGRVVGNILGTVVGSAIKLVVWGLKSLWKIGKALVLSNPLVLGAMLIYKHWQPITGFFGRLWASLQGGFSGLWGTVQGAFSGLWESIKDWFGSLDMASMGRALIEMLAKGIRFSPVGLVYAALKSVLGYVGKLLPSSDAQQGPLSRLTAAGASIVGTLGAGVGRAGPGGLQRPLSRALGAAAAGLAFTLPAPAVTPTPALPASVATLPAPTVTSRRRPTGKDARLASVATLPAPTVTFATLPNITLPAPPAVLPQTPQAQTLPDSLTARPAPLTAPSAKPYTDADLLRLTAAPDVRVERIDRGVHIRELIVHQQPGEDPHALAERVLDAIEQRAQLTRREALFDAD